MKVRPVPARAPAPGRPFPGRIERAAPSGPVAVVILSCDSETWLRRTLATLARGPAVEGLVIDSSSHDASASLAAEAGWGLARLDRADFRHGPARQWALDLTRAPIVVHLVGDAIPLSADLPRRLAAALERYPRAVGAYARQLPRLGADRATCRALRQWTPPAAAVAEQAVDAWSTIGPWARWRASRFDHVCAAVRRSALGDWRYPGVDFGEDVWFAVEALRRGQSLLYVPDAVVEHSHRYSLTQRYRRARACHAVLHRALGLRTLHGPMDLAHALGASLGELGPSGPLDPPGWRRWLETAAELAGQWRGARL